MWDSLGTTGPVHCRSLEDDTFWKLLYNHFKKKHEQIGPCGVIAYLLPRLPLVCERLRRATKETKRETQIGEKMSASNDAAGVKCWRLPNVCACECERGAVRVMRTCKTFLRGQEVSERTCVCACVRVRRLLFLHPVIGALWPVR